MPRGEICTFVDLDCVYNNTRGCDDECADRVAHYQELCVFATTARRNATFDYNISSCIHPEGWRVGTEKWRHYATLNESSEEAQRGYHAPYPLWRYEDVPDQTILNCSCHFYNETFDPLFVAQMLQVHGRTRACHVDAHVHAHARARMQVRASC